MVYISNIMRKYMQDEHRTGFMDVTYVVGVMNIKDSIDITGIMEVKNTMYGVDILDIIDVRYLCGGRPMEVNACFLNAHMVYL
jgi:hypothetical protein